MRSRISLPTLVTLLLLSAVPVRVRANGYELLPGGTQSVARGGAVSARPENAMLLLQDPAGLSLLSGGQMMLNDDVPFHSMCVDSYGYYGWGVYQAGGSELDGGDPLKVKLDKSGKPVVGATYATTPLPQVCNSGRVVGLPQLAWTGKITDDLGIAAGFVAPSLVAGMQFGGADGTISTDAGPRPTPTRYELIRQQVKFGLAPSVGLGYRFAPFLQVGVAMQVYMAHVVTRAVENATSGTQPSSDWLLDLDVHDYFIPAFTFSAHSKPIPELDLMATFHYGGSFDGSGKVTIETNTFHQGAASGAIPYRNAPVPVAEAQVPLPSSLTFGARYAGHLPEAKPAPGKPKGLRDPMDLEQWDVELDATYELASLGNKTRVRVDQDVTVITREAGGGGGIVTAKASDIAPVTVDRHLLNAVALRAGGSYSVLPRELAVNAGVFFETRGQDPAYATIDEFAFQRVGFGLGAMVRLGVFDLLAAYGHIFEETVQVAPPPNQPAEQSSKTDPTRGFDQRVGGSFDGLGNRVGGYVLRDPSAPSASQADAVARVQENAALPNAVRSPRVINAGKYTASFNVLSLGAVYHF
ncbi:MAG: OmpP1/FadL family transporter [Polyangiales bacterium]